MRERNFGIWQRKLRTERNAFLEKQGLTLFTYTPEGGESDDAVTKRVTNFYSALLKRHIHDTILLMSHGGVITRIYLSIFQKSSEEYKQYHPQNAAVTILEINEDKKHTVHVLNCVKHLE